MFKGNRLEPIVRWFSAAGLTRAETQMVLVLVLLGAAGGILSLFRTPSPGPPAASDQRLAAFRSLSSDTAISRSGRDSLWTMLGVDAAAWHRRSDSLRSILDRGGSNAARDSFLDRVDDAPVRRININTGSADELATLPGIGPKLAGRIIAFRTQNGPFRGVEEIKRVKGVGNKMFEKIKPFIDIE